MRLTISERRSCWHFVLMALLALFLSASSAAFADSILRDLDRLELVIEQTIKRLESDIELDREPSSDLVSRVGRQFELSALAAGRADLLEEDYYNLALSLIAGHFGDYSTACQLLRDEMRLQTFRVAREWMRKEISKLEEMIAAAALPMPQGSRVADFYYKEILQDLKKTLIGAGVR